MDLADLTHPERLWWLALLPALILLSLPPRPRRVLPTPHLRQWLRARARLRRRPVRRRHLRLLLLLVAFAAAVFAWAGARTGQRPGPLRLVVVLDASASMAAAGPGGDSAWRQGVERVRTAVAGLPAHVEVALARCAGEVVAVDDLRAALAQGDPFGQAGGPGRLDLAALAAGASDPRTAVWTVTDTLGPARVGPEGALTVVGAPADNVAIVGLRVDDRWPLPDVELSVTVASFAAAARRVRLAVEGDAVDPVPPRPLTLERGAPPAVESFSLRRARGGLLSVVLEGAGDALALDDRVAVSLPAPPAPRILVLGGEEGSLGLRAAARSLAEEAGGEVLPGGEGPRAGFLLAEGGRLPGTRGLRGLTFGTIIGAGELGPGRLIARPPVTDWDREHSTTFGLDLSELRIETALPPDLLPEGRTLVGSDRGPLVVLVEGLETASVHAAFRLQDSNFERLPAFPQFLRRCFAAAYRRHARVEADPANLLSAAESDLRAGARPADRGLPAFGAPGTGLAVPLLLLALLALGLRVYA